jgi:guanylate kinase
LQDNKNDITYLVLGKSGSGKDTLVDILCDRYDYKRVISYTTRPKRNEQDKHIFIDKEDVQKYKQDIVAYTIFKNHQYFCTRQQIEEAKLYIVDWAGINYLKRKMPDSKFKVIYIDVPLFTRCMRMLKRGDGLFKAIGRLINDYHEFKHITYDYKVNNVDLDVSVEQIRQYIELEDAMNEGKILKFNDKTI